MEEMIFKIIETNPGIVTMLLTTITSFLLPVVILILNNCHTRKSKEIEGKIDINKAEKFKVFESKHESTKVQKEHENIVHSNLVNILFSVQCLHIELSGSCVDYQCIDKATDEFQDSFKECQKVISRNQLFLSSTVTGHLYKFYQILAELLIDLQNLKSQERYELAIVCVYNRSFNLAEEVISIQDIFVQQREELPDKFDRAEMSTMSNCCGLAPDQLLMDDYEEWEEKSQLQPDPLPSLEPLHQNNNITE